MCGIIGCYCKDKAQEILLNGLKRLEYRGYDSAGLSIFDGKEINTLKAQGRVAALEERLNAGHEFGGGIGIAHTRWATHGEPNEKNAHPHTVGRVSVVHNGIIENFKEKKAELTAEGRSFCSETDTEVLAALLDKFLNEGKSLTHAAAELLETAQGAMAAAFLIDAQPPVILALKRKSPLFIGRAHDGLLLASDLRAMPDTVEEYTALEDEEFAILQAFDCCFFNRHGRLKKKFIRKTQEFTEYSKAEFEHFMLKEIYEQPRTIADTLSYTQNTALKNADAIKKAEHLHIIACGTAYHAGLLIADCFEKKARLRCSVHYAGEFRYSSPILKSGELCLAISQSGETADTLAALSLALRQGLYCIGLINSPHSTAERECAEVIYTKAGPEVAVAATKSFTAQVAAGIILAARAAEIRACLTHSELRDIYFAASALPTAIAKALSVEEEIKKIAAEISRHKSVFFIGRGRDLPLAYEGALKLKEISYIHAEALAGSELKHGTISLIEKNTPVIALSIGFSHTEKLASGIAEIRARGGRVTVFTDSAGPFDDCEKTVLLPQGPEPFSPLVGAVAVQLLAYHTANYLGRDIDKPRNLAKSVTVE